MSHVWHEAFICHMCGMRHSYVTSLILHNSFRTTRVMFNPLKHKTLMRYIYIHVYACVYMYIHTQRDGARVRDTYTYSCMHTISNINRQNHIYTHIYVIYICIYMYIYTHKYLELQIYNLSRSLSSHTLAHAPGTRRNSSSSSFTSAISALIFEGACTWAKKHNLSLMYVLVCKFLRHLCVEPKQNSSSTDV